MKLRNCNHLHLAVAAAATLVLSTSPARAATIRFVVSERPGEVVHGDSYILPLSDPADIADARALLAADPGTLPSIVVASIAPGADGVNRNWLAPGKPAWSWHITDLQLFADNTIEILDGWPTFVEQDVPGWIANTNGAIGFWNYTITAELPVPEPTTGPLLVAAALAATVARRRRGGR